MKKEFDTVLKNGQYERKKLNNEKNGGGGGIRTRVQKTSAIFRYRLVFLNVKSDRKTNLKFLPEFSRHQRSACVLARHRADLPDGSCAVLRLSLYGTSRANVALSRESETVVDAYWVDR